MQHVSGPFKSRLRPFLVILGTYRIAVFAKAFSSSTDAPQPARGVADVAFECINCRWKTLISLWIASVMLKHRLQATFICLICVWWNAQEKHIIVTEELFHCLLRFCLPWWFNNLMLFMNPLEGKRDFSSLILKVHQTACSVFFPRWIVATVDVPPKPSENSFSGLILHEVFGQNQSDSNFRPQKVVSVHWCHSVRYSGRIYSNFVVRPYEKPLCAFWILW